MDSLLEIILNFSSDGIFITDKEGHTIAYSESYCKYIGATKEELDSKTIKQFFDEGWFSVSVLLQVLETKKTCTDIINYYKTGKEILVTGTPVLDRHGELEYVVLCFRDLSELKRLEAELKASQELLSLYKSQLQSLNTLEDPFGLGIIARSKSMQQVIYLIAGVAKHDSNILLLGETGVGKSILAQRIHDLSDRHKKGDFIKIDCTSIPETLLETELFGYEKGAFTDARKEGKEGIIELADKGTLFLDEIGELSLNLQSKMLNFLEDKKIKRIGGTKFKNVDIRIITATNQNLQELVKAGRFRKDLYYRLNVIPVEIPPLRNRKEDIIPLIKYYEKFFKNKYNLEKNISPEVYEKLLNYNWPGNIRELINVVERMLLLNEKTVLSQLDLQKHYPEELRHNHQDMSLKDTLEKAEKEYIKWIMSSTCTLKEAAEKSGIDISTLVRKKQKYQIFRNTSY